ncbi:hypothetical protein GBAR_LOCUS25366 [Geodia barretti]|nr:hypothetical protein GBAR_LOCUS25366 [Geodia barretti]
MERAVFALFCLSAAFCFASAQNEDLPPCPDDFYLKIRPEAYDERSQPLVERQECLADLSRFLGFPYIARTYFYACNEGFITIRPQPAGPFVCIPFLGSGIGPEIDIPETFERPSLPTPTQPPSRPSPTEPEERPTTSGGLSECPSDSVSNRNRYAYSSLRLTVRKRCYIRTRVHG